MSRVCVRGAVPRACVPPFPARPPLSLTRCPCPSLRLASPARPDDELLHDEELELRADHILLQKLTYALCLEPGGAEVGLVCAALEAVCRAVGRSAGWRRRRPAREVRGRADRAALCPFPRPPLSPRDGRGWRSPFTRSATPSCRCSSR